MHGLGFDLTRAGCHIQPLRTKPLAVLSSRWIAAVGLSLQGRGRGRSGDDARTSPGAEPQPSQGLRQRPINPSKAKGPRTQERGGPPWRRLPQLAPGLQTHFQALQVCLAPDCCFSLFRKGIEHVAKRRLAFRRNLRLLFDMLQSWPQATGETCPTGLPPV